MTLERSSQNVIALTLSERASSYCNALEQRSQNVIALTLSERASSYCNALERKLAICFRFNALGESWLLFQLAFQPARPAG